ncbi:MAG: 30S ribosomal protein S8 [Candidatus Levybacteria bacterium RIFCSPHIGHO2_02_FULL_37_13]|nr:MAG: 30S ribosomal protein S8 [Candidatus Levybacteria bacterium RIFCSPHIGHO2_02_FULL_37_13]OGH30458.1 MAG: 30S ribosomal protein S8 [Candidatus Levybacteria bacterium RIFCSPHIGHO2_12_FULL_37_9]OGH40012.1 MAG: 30S ribosomal protein S8 [Candidatus Levybacteria bacterium RIFCSPLOWO2_01_FULL_37_26]
MNKVSDFVVRIKNASLAKRRKLLVPYCNINKKVGQVLVKEGFLESIKESVIDNKKVLEAVIRYERRNPVLTDIAIIAKPSLHVYTKFSGIPEIQRRGKHTIIISTSKGIMSGKEAYKKGLGGEVLFKIW